MNKLIINPSQEDKGLLESLIGQSLVISIGKVRRFHEVAPLLFYRMFEIFGKNLHKNSYPFGNTCIAFEIDTEKVLNMNGWFTLDWSGEPGLSFHIKFYNTVSYPRTEDSQSFELLSVTIGYQYNYQSSDGDFASSAKQVRDYTAKPIISIGIGPKFEGWLGNRKQFNAEYFVVDQLIKELILPLDKWAYQQEQNFKPREFYIEHEAEMA